MQRALRHLQRAELLIRNPNGLSFGGRDNREVILPNDPQERHRETQKKGKEICCARKCGRCKKFKEHMISIYHLVQVEGSHHATVCCVCRDCYFFCSDYTNHMRHEEVCPVCCELTDADEHTGIYVEINCKEQMQDREERKKQIVQKLKKKKRRRSESPKPGTSLHSN